MMYQFQKAINSDKLKTELAALSVPAPQRIDTVDLNVYIYFSSQLEPAQESNLNLVIQNHVQLTTSESLSVYLDSSVFPFVTKLIRDFAAENIAMGITQAQKTGPVLGMFAKQYDVNSDGKPFSLKDTFDTGSLYEALKVIQHLRNNPNDYSGLSPFVTDARLLSMKNKIETFLGVPNTP